MLSFTDPPNISDEAMALRNEFPPGSEVMLSIDQGPIETWFIVGVAVAPGSNDAVLLISPVSPIMVPQARVEELIARTLMISPDQLRGKKMTMQ
jgi:hypothetical protein